MRAVARLTGLAPGEGLLVAALAAVMALTAAGGALGIAAADALLLANFDLSRLPLLYVLLGATTFVFTLAASALLATGDRARLYVALPAILAAAALAARILAALDTPWAYALLWLAMSVVVTLQGIAAWGLAGAACDLRQAKRLFPLLNAAKIGGTVAGSVAVAALVRIVDVRDLLVLWAAGLAAAAGIAYALRARVPRVEAQASAGLAAEIQRGFAIVRGSSLLRLLAIALVLFSLLYFALALPFSRGAKAAYPSEADLASFLGLFNGVSTVAALVLSLFVANRLYARFGVVDAIVLFGAVYLAGFVAIAITGAFAALVAARFAQAVWLSGIADTAYQALFNPVPPERRDQIRAFMEGVPGQAGIVLAGAVLLVGEALDPRALSVVGVAASFATIAVLWRIRPAYGRALADALRAGRPQAFRPERDPFGAVRTDAGARAVVLEGLRSGDRATRRVSAEILRDMAMPATRPELVLALNDADRDVRVATIAALAALGAADVLERYERDEDPEVRAHVAMALGGDRVLALARDPETQMRRALAEALALRPDAAPAALRELTVDPDRAVRLLAIGALGRSAATDAAWLAPVLDDPDPATADAALDALAELRTPAAHARLVDLTRDAVARAQADAARLATLDDLNSDAGQLLRAALRERARRPAHRAVRAALATAGRAGADLVIESLESADRDRRASAVELLEARGGEILRPLTSLWEPPKGDGRSATALLADLAANDPDEIVRESARHAIRGGGEPVETLSTISLMERLLFLRKVAIFGDLAPQELKQIASLAREELYEDGATIVRHGDAGDRMFVITRGSVRVIRADGSVIATREAGEVVGEMAILKTDMRRVASLVAQGEVRALTIGRREFEGIIRDRPQIAFAIIGVLASRLAELST